MHWKTIVLTATDTPATIKDLLSLTDKYRHITRIVLYPEAGNNSGANGPARVGGSDVDRVAADAGVGDDAYPNGFPLVPGIIESELFARAPGGVYHLDLIYITGETGDIFQMGYETH